jgi:D-galactose 1-dehydrogenase
MSIRLAIVGLGKIAHAQHLPVLRAHGAFTIVAAASPGGVLEGVPVFDSIDALLASGVQFDAVTLCQPPQSRCADARRAIAAGKSVFLEKPPGATLAEVEALVQAARTQGTTLFAAWHSRYAPAVGAARTWLKERRLVSVRIEWKEDVRVWHPGQAWIWQPGGFGVFDPGINALSIASSILPNPFFLESGTLFYPSNCEAPIAAQLKFRDWTGVPVEADFDFLQTGQQTWDIHVVTDDGDLLLGLGGDRLSIQGSSVPMAPEAEYRGLYDRFAALIAAGESDVDITPLRHVADAFMRSRRVQVAAFHDPPRA